MMANEPDLSEDYDRGRKTGCVLLWRSCPCGECSSRCVAHDCNNFLTGIMGNLKLLQGRLARGRIDEFDRFLAAQGAGKRAAALTQRLLAFSRR